MKAINNDLIRRLLNCKRNWKRKMRLLILMTRVLIRVLFRRLLDKRLNFIIPFQFWNCVWINSSPLIKRKRNWLINTLVTSVLLKTPLSKSERQLESLPMRKSLQPLSKQKSRTTLFTIMLTLLTKRLILLRRQTETLRIRSADSLSAAKWIKIKSKSTSKRWKLKLRNLKRKLWWHKAIKRTWRMSSRRSKRT